LSPFRRERPANAKIASHVTRISTIRFSVLAFWNRHLETGSQTRMETLENERRRTVVSRTVHRSQTATVLCPLGRYAP
jgi:hypothetical protein